MSTNTYSSLTILLIFTLLVQAGYAESFDKAKIQDVTLVKILGAGSASIFDTGRDDDNKGAYQISFSRKKFCIEPEVSLFRDLEGNDQITIEDPLEYSRKAGRMIKNTIFFINNIDSTPLKYRIEFSNKDAKPIECATLEGYMPELQVNLGNIKVGNGRDLILNNVSSKNIRITNIETSEDRPILVEFDNNVPLEIAEGSSSSIPLIPADNSCSSIEKGDKKFTLKVQYEVVGETPKENPDSFEIVIGYSCDWLLEKAEKDNKRLLKKLDDTQECKQNCLVNYLSYDSDRLITCIDKCIEENREIVE